MRWTKALLWVVGAAVVANLLVWALVATVDGLQLRAATGGREAGTDLVSIVRVRRHKTN
jgi:hypothetical protein